MVVRRCINPRVLWPGGCHRWVWPQVGMQVSPCLRVLHSSKQHSSPPEWQEVSWVVSSVSLIWRAQGIGPWGWKPENSTEH